jgi:hypothetical protein
MKTEAEPNKAIKLKEINAPAFSFAAAFGGVPADAP